MKLFRRWKRHLNKKYKYIYSIRDVKIWAEGKLTDEKLYEVCNIIHGVLSCGGDNRQNEISKRISWSLLLEENAVDYWFSKGRSYVVIKRNDFILI